MSLIALGSAKGSPGVTTAAVLLAAAWAGEKDGEGPLVVEADPDGGALAARYGLGPEPGLVSAAAAARRGIEPGDVRDHVQEIPGPIRVLAGPASADQAHAALAAGSHLVRALGALDAPVIVDCGRLGPGSPALALAEAASLVVLVARPRLDEVHHVLHRVRSLRDTCTDLGLVLVGRRPYPPDEVAAAVGVPVLGVLADDASTAEILRDGRGSPRSLRRSALARSAVEVAAAVRQAVGRRAPSPSRPPAEGLPAPAPVGAAEW